MMRKLKNCSLLLFFFIVAIADAQNSSFQKLSALKGTWRMETTQGILYESWTIVNDSSMIGKTYQVKNNDTIIFERVKLIERGGDILYIPTTENQNDRKPVVFKLKIPHTDTLTFENPAHDFPQRVIYTLPKGESLLAWIEGTTNGKEKRSEYYYKKIH